MTIQLYFPLLFAPLLNINHLDNQAIEAIYNADARSILKLIPQEKIITNILYQHELPDFFINKENSESASNTTVQPLDDYVKTIKSICTSGHVDSFSITMNSDVYDPNNQEENHSLLNLKNSGRSIKTIAISANCHK